MASMAWLSELDAKRSKWPAPARWAYSGVKWCLIAVGAFILLGLMGERMGLWTL